MRIGEFAGDLGVSSLPRYVTQERTGHVVG
ncbi:hypothetical protein NC653_014327 [Populus alba x Populus x berolinensis]|uniref:Uncharacterized protein n=1 Tax=Populus alba x Populus x berolinensis TaxID=444605 RepID=A0AAD6W4S3_9ROSI|nr:hypothetical protein NC653_014327 [Populus alba x Populus x berolinensis]